MKLQILQTIPHILGVVQLKILHRLYKSSEGPKSLEEDLPCIKILKSFRIFRTLTENLPGCHEVNEIQLKLQITKLALAF